MKNKNKNLLILFVLIVVTTLKLWLTQAYAQAQVNIEFCNEWKNSATLDWDNVNPEEENEICIQASNIDEEETILTMFFVDWVINPYTPKYIACKDESDSKKSLSIFAKFEEDGTKMEKIIFNIKPWEVVKKTAKVNFKPGFSWMSYWCLVTLTWKQEIVKWKLNILLRKWNVIKAKVNWKIELWLNLLSNFDDVESLKWSWLKQEEVKNYVQTLHIDEKMIIQEYLEDWNIKIVSKLDNAWNVKMVWQANLFLTNSYWYEKTLTKDIVILPFEQNKIMFDIKDLPFYKWKYDVKMDIKYKPEFEFLSDDITDDMRLEKAEIFNVSFSIFPTKLAIEVAFWLIFLIVLTFYIIHKRKNKAQVAPVAVSAAPQVDNTPAQ